MPRIFHPQSLQTGQVVDLTLEGARHVQVLRLQPGDPLTVFGSPDAGGEFDARVVRMGRSQVSVEIGEHHPIDRQPPWQMTLAVGMPANERMDWLVEKATELGVTRIIPLMTERTVVRLKGERADKKQAHWQAVAVAACEQCGGNRVPVLEAVQTLDDWLKTAPADGGWRGVLSLAEGSMPLRQALKAVTPQTPICLALGPEGGWSAAEEQQLLQRGFAPVGLGNRVLRTETAAIAALAAVLLGD